MPALGSRIQIEIDEFEQPSRANTRLLLQNYPRILKISNLERKKRCWTHLIHLGMSQRTVYLHCILYTMNYQPPECPLLVWYGYLAGAVTLAAIGICCFYCVKEMTPLDLVKPL